MDSEDVIVVSENRFLWGSESNPSAEKTPPKKFKVHIRPGPCQPAKDQYLPSECFKFFFQP